MNLKLRWINYAGYEMVLPNGKVVVIDPCTDFENKVTAFSEADYTGADYIILSHTHFDHTKDVGYLEKKFEAKVIVGSLSAAAAAAYFDINMDHLYPVIPNERYDFDDLTLHVFRSKHTFFNTPENNIRSIKKQRETDRTFPHEHLQCDINGYIEYMDYMITTRENFRIFIAGGGPHKFTYRNIYRTMYEHRPNLVFRQTSTKYTPEEFGQMAADFGAQYVFPLHQDGIVRKSTISIEEYIGRANSELERLGSFTRVFNPVQHKWYQIETSISDVDGLTQDKE